MKIGILIGLGIGGTLLSGSAPDAAEVNASVPGVAAPIPLVPEAYTASSVPVPPVASLRSAPVVPAAPQPSATAIAVASPSVGSRLPPLPAPAIAAERRAEPVSAAKSDQYHPHWVVDVH